MTHLYYFIQCLWFTVDQSVYIIKSYSNQSSFFLMFSKIPIQANLWEYFWPGGLSQRAAYWLYYTAFWKMCRVTVLFCHVIKCSLSLKFFFCSSYRRLSYQWELQKQPSFWKFLILHCIKVMPFLTDSVLGWIKSKGLFILNVVFQFFPLISPKFFCQNSQYISSVTCYCHIK